jgi:cysteine-rich repeat protein
MNVRTPSAWALGWAGVAALWAGCAHAAAARPAPGRVARLTEVIRGLPLAFEANRGQADPQAQFLSRGDGYALALAPTEAVLRLGGPRDEGAVLRMKVLGANRRATGAGLSELRGRSHYLVGSDRAAWRVGVPRYGAVRYEAVYPGVDLVYHGSNQGQLEYDFVVGPGADPGVIRLGFAGSRRLGLDPSGNLVLQTGRGRVVWRAPVAYQDTGGTRRPVAARYEVGTRNEVGFRVGDYDRSAPLVIDPVLAYSTLLGGSQIDEGLAIATDASGAAYVTGRTCSHDFPTLGPFQGTPGPGCDAFVSKFTVSGVLEYSTYLGGDAPDQGKGIAVDGSGSAYVTGETGSADFPTLNPVQATLGGGGFDAFVAKLSPAGDALVYSTFLGGSAGDQGTGIAVDGSGSACLTGFTAAPDFPTVNALQATRSGAQDAFVARLSPTGGSLVYSTYLGGSSSQANGETGHGIALDGSGNAYVVGETDSADFPTKDAAQGARAGLSDAFVAKLPPSGTALAYSTYLGGALVDAGAAVAVDEQGAAYVAGTTRSPDFPTLNAVQASHAGNGDAFAVKLSAQGLVEYSTYLGGGGADRGAGVGVDAARNAYVAGTTASGDFPMVDPVQADGFGDDAFLARLSADGGSLIYSTYLVRDATAQEVEVVRGVAVDGAGNAHVVGLASGDGDGNDFNAGTGDNVNPDGSADESDVILFKVVNAPSPQCSDGVDNADAEDTLPDAADAGCHDDGNPANPASYDPEDDDETDVCGDGVPHPGEQCDDGNATGGDGCSSTCTIENRPPACGGAFPTRAVLWPPNHRLVSVGVGGVTDPEGSVVNIRVTAIAQDEPVRGANGCGHTCPDGKGVGTALAKVRAERAGSPHVPGNGRVYHIAFTGTDPQGAVCQGTVRVCVPHDQRPGSTCVDEGPLHDSSVCRF